jgi:hypothetical protein
MSDFDMIDNFALLPPITTLINNGTILSGTNTRLKNVSGAGTLALSDDGLFTIGSSVQGTVDFAALNGVLSLYDVFTGDLPDASGLLIRNFGTDDTIHFGTGSGGLGDPFSVTSAAYTLLSPAEVRLDITTARGSTSLFFEGDYTAHPLLEFATGTTLRLDGTSFIIVCFVTGTRILTRRGPVAVERLSLGDEVMTATQRAWRPIRWIGHRRLDLTRHPTRDEAAPIRAGAFAPDQPSRDLYLSPDHAVFVDGVLIPVKHLVNGTSVALAPMDQVTYWHVELDRHDVLLAEGLPVESYLDSGDRSFFTNGGPVTTLHPSLPTLLRDARGCAPLVVSGPILARIRHQLAERSATLMHEPGSRKSGPKRQHGRIAGRR